MIVELTVECEIVNDRIARIGLKDTDQASWVVLMILESVIHRIRVGELASAVASARILSADSVPPNLRRGWGSR